MKQCTVYLAGKVPKSDEELENYSDWRSVFERVLKKESLKKIEIVCLDPSHVHFDISDIYGIFGRDIYMINQSDFVVIDARSRIGPGTSQEMLIAKYFKKPVVTILPKNSHYWKDTKIRDKKAKAWMNPFIAATTDIFAESIEDAAKKVSELINNGKTVNSKGIGIINEAILYYKTSIMQKEAYLHKTHKKSPLILASKSLGRENVLRNAGFDFEVIPSGIDESKIRENDPEKLVKTLALKKAEDVAEKSDNDKVIIGADTVVVLSGKIIEKPKDKEEAFRMLKELSGKTHTVYDGVAVICKSLGNVLVDVARAEVTFRKLTESEIKDYLKSDDALSFAGGYNIEGTKSMRFIERINGSYTCVVGLPLELLIPMLKECGVDF